MYPQSANAALSCYYANCQLNTDPDYTCKIQHPAVGYGRLKVAGKMASWWCDDEPTPFLKSAYKASTFTLSGLLCLYSECLFARSSLSDSHLPSNHTLQPNQFALFSAKCQPHPFPHYSTRPRCLSRHLQNSTCTLKARPTASSRPSTSRSSSKRTAPRKWATTTLRFLSKKPTRRNPSFSRSTRTDVSPR